jgi:hypothetical protein
MRKFRYTILIIGFITFAISLFGQKTNPENKAKIANRYYNKGDIQSLEKLVNKWIEKSPSDMKMEPYFWKGKLYILSNQIDKGFIYLAASARDDPKNVTRWKYLIETALFYDKKLDAAVYIKEAKNNFGNNQPWLNSLIKEYENSVTAPTQQNTPTKPKTNKERFSDKLEGWIGANIMDYIHANGVYTDVKRLPNGGSIYIFSHKSENVMPIWGDNGDIWGGGSYTLNCTIELETNKENTIISWRWEGNNCF